MVATSARIIMYVGKKCIDVFVSVAREEVEASHFD